MIPQVQDLIAASRKHLVPPDDINPSLTSISYGGEVTLCLLGLCDSSKWMRLIDNSSVFNVIQCAFTSSHKVYIPSCLSASSTESSPVAALGCLPPWAVLPPPPPRLPPIRSAFGIFMVTTMASVWTVKVGVWLLNATQLRLIHCNYQEENCYSLSARVSVFE